ncbi:hypothetical protein B9479_001644 [Cryptococcus floricola]|uniref:Amino acid transporter transmembrane domain-containing protein n=1 Tax=Cryptococcus floricola TaxID=2591691 RepID=A0A5D3B3F5_9TREE|nr:hypothetical protein B9479_001644 [Cryptococcus floricola]
MATSTPSRPSSKPPSSPLPPITPLTAEQYTLNHPPSETGSRRSSLGTRSSTDTRFTGALDLSARPSGDQGGDRPSLDSPPPTGSTSGQSQSSHSTLEFLDNDLSDLDAELDIDNMDDLDYDEESMDTGVDEPLVRGRGSRPRRRARRKGWEEEKVEKGLIELIPSIILSHPLPLLPLLALLPYNFLPAGVVFFIPIICVLALLSICAHIVIVYLSWYLKMPSFEDVFANVTGKYSKYGLWGARVALITAVLGMVVSWIETIHPLLEPVVETYLPSNKFFQSRIVWTIGGSTILIPSLLPSRMSLSLRRSPIFFALLLPIIAFLVIGRTVEIKKAADQTGGDAGNSTEAAVAVASNALGHLAKRRFGLAGKSSAGAGLTTLTIFFSPHINTLPIHGTLARSKRASFFMPCLFAGAIILVLALPLALVPYYLLPLSDGSPDTSTISSPNTNAPSGIFGHLPADDAWLNLARILQVALTLGSTNIWILRGRDVVLKAMNVEGGDRYKAGRWVGLACWVIVVGLACIGGWVADKVELMGVLGVLIVGWFLPSLFFIIAFHVRSPLSIIFPSRQNPSTSQLPPPNNSTHSLPRRGRGDHSRSSSLSDPTTDVLLARKERQLQKRRLGRRLWQDLIVYLGILPVGCVTIAWTAGRFVGLW